MTLVPPPAGHTQPMCSLHITSTMKDRWPLVPPAAPTLISPPSSLMKTKDVGRKTFSTKWIEANVYMTMFT